MSDRKDPQPFWKTKTLAEMTRQEWESLCDGCARCCAQKLEDIDSGDVVFTNVACRYLNQQTCRCTVYSDRTVKVPECIVVSEADTSDYRWFPDTCAYRLVLEKKDLAWWHPLVSGSPESVHEAGISVRGKVIDETHVHPEQLVEHIIDWIKV